MLWYHLQPIQTYNSLGEYAKALDLVKEALWFNDSFAEAHLEAAFAHKGIGNIPFAKHEAQKALELAPALKKAQELLASF